MELIKIVLIFYSEFVVISSVIHLNYIDWVFGEIDFLTFRKIRLELFIDFIILLLWVIIYKCFKIGDTYLTNNHNFTLIDVRINNEIFPPFNFFTKRNLKPFKISLNRII